MPFVLDTSVALAWAYEDETSSFTDRILEMLDRDAARVPSIWPLEVANAVLVGERRSRLTLADTERFLEIIRSLPIEIEASNRDESLASVLHLARTYGLSSYDASFLELASRRGLPLATQDQRLRDAAERAGIMVLE